MKIRAQFKGKDKSLDYRTGVIYDLELFGSRITCETNLKGFCIYNSIEAFLINWKIIS